MGTNFNRREVITGSLVGSLVGLSGCISSLGGSNKVSVTINLVNLTSEKLRPWVQMEGKSEDIGAQSTGEDPAMYPKSTKRIQLKVPTGKYKFKVIIDEPRYLTKREQWRVTEKRCKRNSWAIFTRPPEERQIHMLIGDCS